MKSNKLASSYCDKASKLLAVGNNSESLKNYNNFLRFATSEFAESQDNFSKFGAAKGSAEEIINNGECLNDLINDKREFFKLSQPANSKIPFIANCLEVKENDVYGRFIATNKDLSTGDIVIIEEPFYKVVSNEDRNLRCAICLKQNLLHLLPCEKCTTGELLIPNC